MGAVCSSKRRPLSGGPASHLPSLTPAKNELRKVATSNLLLCDANCCTNSWLYLDLPECIGWQCNGRVCCVEGACCLKFNSPQLYCICCEMELASLNTCCSGQVQTCCIVNECSFPFCGDATPAQFAKLFIVCYPDVGICKPQYKVMARI